ncbi:MAG: tetratricopeptide repeat protein [Bdellovibrionales bacterium]|nr:tetratricopeptide repeat protein [Bdellovibrionales bacterium]
MVNKYFLFLLCVFLTSCVSTEKQVKKAELHHQLALSLMKKCQYPSALTELRKAIELKSDEPLFYHSIALLYFQFKKYEKAIQYLKKALRLNPNFTSARIHLGRSLIEVNKWQKGVTELEKAKEDLTYRYPENIHTHLGLAFYKRKKYFEAEKHFQVARAVKKEDCHVALYHAKSLYFLGQFPKATAILEPSKKWCESKLPSCSSPSFDSYFFAALAYDKTNQRPKALLNLKTFLNKAKDSVYREEAKKYQKLWDLALPPSSKMEKKLKNI